MREELSCLSGRATHLQLPPPVLQKLLVPDQSGCQLLQLSVHIIAQPLMFASSSLEYEDVTGAVDYLIQALKLLQDPCHHYYS